MFTENRRNITSIENTKGLRKEIDRLKKEMISAKGKEVIQIKSQIMWLEKKLKELF